MLSGWVLFWVAVGALCALCGVLAALLVVADRVLNNYGTRTIRINGGEKTIVGPGGETLLSLLGSEKLFIPSACGGRGSCGLCKLKVTRGGGSLLPTEEPHLSNAERAAGTRLACQLKVREDMDIEVPRHLFAIRQFRARVAALEPLTYDIKRLRLELLDPETISFVPGQYVQLQTPVYGKNPDPVYRAYSIASDPTADRHLDLIIRLVPNGICTTWVFTLLKVGDEVRLNGPYGEFRLHDTEHEMIFIAGGSGMAPFLSFLAELQRQQSRRRIRYFFGARAVRDLFLLERLREFEKNLADFRFIPALSEPQPGDNWDGERGLITDVVGRHYPDCADKEAYLCGSPGMCDACVKVLTQHGLPADRISFDKFA
ncbi:MAG: oxidoreductase [Lentisphaerae bacterium RIFOXYB12_FULL_65_16]|nr:MAG: oxidoreductase [Lentisphaerae bacterium RIFOXYA12_64_32]OGV88685.1 MAG: oxidoreductase [Lentisphaerae bacterium RIFOXYB12_FULL_65_16]